MLIQLVAQRTESDCCIAVLAMYLGRTYEDVLEAAVQVQHRPHRRGMYVTQIIKTAKRLGVTLRRKRTFDTETDQGIVSVVYHDSSDDHVVVLKEGLLFDTDYSVWEPEVYKSVQKARLTELLWRENAE